MAESLGSFDPMTTYSAAAEEYARASRHYWEFLSFRTVEHLNLQQGQSVLDAACGTAPAAIAAAGRVGVHGRVVGVDYAPGMLSVARRRVGDASVSNVELVQGDILGLPYGAEFDAVVCVLGIFFINDMAAAVRALWSHVRPGGTLAVTTFGPDVWTPVLGYFVDTARAARPGIELILPWRRTEDPEVLGRTMLDAGVEGAQIVREVESVPFRIEDWRTIVMGSALRRIAEDLGPACEGVLEETERRARDEHVSTVTVGANYATAAKPR